MLAGDKRALQDVRVAQGRMGRDDVEQQPVGRRPNTEVCELKGA